MTNPPLLPLPQQVHLDGEQKLHLLLSQMMPNHWNHHQSWYLGLEVGWLVGYWFVGGQLVGGQLAGEQLVGGLPVAVDDAFFASGELWHLLSAILCGRQQELAGSVV